MTVTPTPTPMPPTDSRETRRTTRRRRLRAAIPVVAALLALGAVVLMILSAYFFRPTPTALDHYRPTKGPKSDYNIAAIGCLLGGALLLVIALVLARRSPPFARAARPRLAPLRPRWIVLLLVPGILMLCAVAEANGAVAGIDALAGMRPAVQLVLLVSGIGLVAVALGGISPYPPGPLSPQAEKGGARRAVKVPLHNVERGSQSHSQLPSPLAGREYRGGANRRAEIALILLLTVLALTVRFWELGDRVRVMVDEGHFALGITYFWEFPDAKLLEPMPTAASFPFIFSYGQAGLVAVFGRNFLGLRALSAILGALTVPALYGLARALYDRTTAIMAALILLTFPPHLHYSRLGLNNIADPLFGTLALMFLARGLRTNRRIEYVLGGVMLGLTQYFYEGGRLLYPPLAFSWLVFGWIAWRPRPALRGMIVALLAFVIVAMPVYVTLIGVDFPLVDRLEKTQLDNGEYWNREREPDTLETRLAHFHHSLLMYVHHPENTVVYYYLYYGGTHPLVLEYLVPALLLGFVIVWWRWHWPGMLPGLWILATSAGNALLVESAVSARYVVVFPALALLIAVGLRYTLPLVWPFRRERFGARQAAPLLLILIAVGIAVGQGYFYFGPFLDHFNNEVRDHVEYDVEDALLRAADFPPGTVIHIVGEKVLPQMDAQRFLNFLADDLQVRVYTPADMRASNLENMARDCDHVFFFAPDDVQTLAHLAEVFGLLRPERTPYDLPPHKGLLMVHIPALIYAPGPESPDAVG
ncbi:MAG: glycosyltransferase family 39 protein [Anaerolineae bacterium]|nr:glycosyltransferase family 39 protein [Anaerolineae bacterium]